MTLEPDPESSRPLAVVFDDDGSPDGTVALLYLLCHPQVSLKAVCISFGEARPEVYIQHIGRMLDHLGAQGIPLGAGRSVLAPGGHEFPERIHQAADRFWGIALPGAEKTYPVRDAAELMAEVIGASPEPVDVFLSGTCTNLAEALRLAPWIRERIACVTFMGGAIYTPGDLRDFLPQDPNTTAEWNVYADPAAAREVFESGLMLRLAPLDATQPVGVGREDTRRWRQGGPAAKLAADFYDMLVDLFRRDQAPSWDLTAAAVMVEPELCGSRMLSLRVITEPGDTLGQTAVVQGGEVNTLVCLTPHVERIRQRFVEVFTGAAPGSSA